GPLPSSARPLASSLAGFTQPLCHDQPHPLPHRRRPRRLDRQQDHGDRRPAGRPPQRRDRDRRGAPRGLAPRLGPRLLRGQHLQRAVRHRRHPHRPRRRPPRHLDLEDDRRPPHLSRSLMPRPPLLLLGLAGLLAVGLACEAEVEVPEATVPPEAVERYRTGVVVQMQEIDGAIAALETTAEQADSATAAAYGPALDVLRRERQAIQAALDGLHGTTPEAFDAATAALDARIDEFEEQVGDAPLVLALDAEQLRRAAAARFEALDREVQESPALQ